jgi:hypothetical protein
MTVRTLHSWTKHLVQTQMLTSIGKNIVEINGTQPLLMVMMKRFPLVKSKKTYPDVKVDTTAKEKTDLGMFYLQNIFITPSDLFSKDMPNKIYANFTCKSKECNNVNCNFIHPRRPSKLKCETILAIANHFTKRDIGWFNKYHFMKMPNITDKVKKLLGNTKGSNSKTA